MSSDMDEYGILPETYKDLPKEDLIVLLQTYRSRALKYQEILRQIEASIRGSFSYKIEMSKENQIALYKLLWGSSFLDYFKEENFKDESMPILSESFLYMVVGKDAARSVLYPLESIQNLLSDKPYKNEFIIRQKEGIERIFRYLTYFKNAMTDAEREKELTQYLYELKCFLGNWNVDPLDKLEK